MVLQVSTKVFGGLLKHFRIYLQLHPNDTAALVRLELQVDTKVFGGLLKLGVHQQGAGQFEVRVRAIGLELQDPFVFRYRVVYRTGQLQSAGSKESSLPMVREARDPRARQRQERVQVVGLQ